MKGAFVGKKGTLNNGAVKCRTNKPLWGTELECHVTTTANYSCLH